MTYTVTITQRVNYREECIFEFDTVDRAVNFMQWAIKASPPNTEITLTGKMVKEVEDESVQASES